MDKAQSLQSFWEGFGLPAYDMRNVPIDAKVPYITYDVSIDGIDAPVNLSASVWYRSTSWAPITAKATEIEEALVDGGKVIPLDKGYVWITKGYPFMQRMDDPTDDMIKRYYINVQVEFLSK